MAFIACGSGEVEIGGDWTTVVVCDFEIHKFDISTLTPINEDS